MYEAGLQTMLTSMTCFNLDRMFESKIKNSIVVAGLKAALMIGKFLKERNKVFKKWIIIFRISISRGDRRRRQPMDWLLLLLDMFQLHGYHGYHGYKWQCRDRQLGTKRSYCDYWYSRGDKIDKNSKIKYKVKPVRLKLILGTVWSTGTGIK